MSIAEKFEIIADAVYEKGLEDKDEQIWKSMTMDGTRANFTYFLAYSDWSGYEFIKPIKPTGGINHFAYSSIMTEFPKNIDFSEILIDTTDYYAYRRDVCAYNRKLEIFPDVNMRAIGGLESWFYQCYKLHTIELLRVNSDTIYSNNDNGTSSLTFGACSNLTNITFEGEIGHHISFRDSPLLSVASMKNIIKHLVNYSGTDNAGVYVLTFQDGCWTNLEADSTPQDEGIEFSGTWREYVSSLGWAM